MSCFAVVKYLSASVLLFGCIATIYGAYVTVQAIGNQAKAGNNMFTIGNTTFYIATEYYRHSARMVMLSAGFFSLITAIAMVGVVTENFGLSQLGKQRSSTASHDSR